MAQTQARAKNRERTDVETYDGYSRVVAINSSGTVRVIVCRDGIQWIVQRSKGVGQGEREWRGVSFCRTKEALLLCVGPELAHCAALLALPERLEDIGEAIPSPA